MEYVIIGDAIAIMALVQDIRTVLKIVRKCVVNQALHHPQDLNCGVLET
jgi:hypothetical protein